MHQYGGDDKWYLDAVIALTRKMQAHLPAGPQNSFRRRFGNIRAAQFNLCKLLIALQFTTTGKRGNHARAPKSDSGQQQAPEQEADSDELPEAPPHKRRKVQGQ